MRTFPVVLALVFFALVASAGAVPMYATNGSTLVRFDSATPGLVTSVPVTGLAVGEALVGIDVRAANGRLYGVGSSDHVYTIDPASGVATQVGSSPFMPSLETGGYGVDLNPASDRIRVVATTEQNLRLNPLTGALAAVDSDITPVGDVVGIAHTNNVPGATTTAVYAIDRTTGTLRIFTNPNSGTTSTVGALGLGSPLNAALGLDVAGNGTMYASILSGTSRLYAINPATGAATLVGTIGDGSVPYLGLAAASFDQLSFTTDVVRGAEGTVSALTVRRVNPSSGAMVVSYAVTPQSADSGDHGASNGAVSWSAGDGGDRTIALPLHQDAFTEGDESFTVTLTGPASPGVVVAPATATVTIADVPPVPAPPLPPPAPFVAPNTAPRLSVARIARQKLATVLSRGLTVRVTADEPCRLTAELKDMRRKRLARATASLRAGVRTTVRPKPSKAVRRTYRKRRSLKVVLELSCADAGGLKSKVSRTALTLRRG